MATISPSASWQRPLIVMVTVILAVVVIACLYLAEAVFVPLALATLLTFMLSALVSRLQRLGLGRIPAVLLVVILTGVLLGGIGWGVTYQVTRLLRDLPTHTETIRKKINDLHGSGKGSILGNLQAMVENLSQELENKQPTEASHPNSLERVVVIQPEGTSWLTKLPTTVRPLLEPLASAGLTLILVIFMLIKREDLRNRLISVVGHGRLTHTTKVLDDAGQRISRYLVMQFVINASFGLILSCGLMIIGLDYAFLWGFLAALLRYLPYIGTLLATIPPIILSLAVFDDWMHPLLVVGLFLALELVTANVLEPLLFGHSTGISSVALLLAAAFWTWLWGPVGLVLSGPLTVCLVVLGKNVPSMKFFDVLMGDEPPLDTDVTYYQRLLAMDQDEATEIVATYVKASSAEQVYDNLLVPALIYAKQDRARDNLSESEEQFVLEATSEIVEDLGEREREPSPAAEAPASSSGNGSKAPPSPKVTVVGCPAADKGEELALRMFQQLLDPDKCVMEIASGEMLFSELVSFVAEKRPALICIAALPPGGLARTRYLCKRLHKEFPETKILVGRWGLKGHLEQNRELLLAAGANQVGTSLLETLKHVTEWLPVLSLPQRVVETH